MPTCLHAAGSVLSNKISASESISSRNFINGALLVGKEEEVGWVRHSSSLLRIKKACFIDLISD